MLKLPFPREIVTLEEEFHWCNKCLRNGIRTAETIFIYKTDEWIYFSVKEKDATCIACMNDRILEKEREEDA